MKVPPPPPDFPQPRLLKGLFTTTAKIDSPEHSGLREHHLQRTRELWKGYEEKRADRERNLTRLLDTHHRDRVVLVMTMNQGHADLFANWVASCDAHSIEVRSWTVVFPLDDGAAARAEALGFAVYHDGISYGNHPTAAAKCYGNEEFAGLMFPKTAVVQDLLNLGYNVLYQDVDMIWWRDPLEILWHPRRRHLDAQFMYDGPSWDYHPLHVNTGFFLLRNGEQARTLWRQVCQRFDEIVWHRSQQKIVNPLLVIRYFRGLKLDVLPEEHFANGHLFSEKSVEKLPPDPCVIHCSWTTDLEHKLQKLRFADLWYLDGGGRRRWQPPSVRSRGE